MKRLKLVALGMVAVLGLLVVPSFASSPELVEDPVYSLASDTAYVVLSSVSPYASSTPSYPSGTAYAYYASSGITNSPLTRYSDFYTAVSTSLSNGFNTLTSGLYVIRGDLQGVHDILTSWNTSLFSSSSSSGSLYSYNFASSDGVNGRGGSSAQGVLPAINNNLYYGFQSMTAGFRAVKNSLNDQLHDFFYTGFVGDWGNTFWDSDGNPSLQLLPGGYMSAMRYDTYFNNVLLSSILKRLPDSFDSAMFNQLSEFFYTSFVGDWGTTFWDSDGNSFLQELPGGYMSAMRYDTYFTNVLLSSILKRLPDSVDIAIQDATVSQRNEWKDTFTGDGSKGVQSGQIGTLGDVSSSAGSLFDSGGNVGNVFSAVGNVGSSVWSWFSSDNANAINGVGGVSVFSVDDEAPSPSFEIVDFYGVQRDELLSLLGGG